MKKKIFCVPRVFATNVATDFVKNQKSQFRDFMSMSWKDVCMVILISGSISGVFFWLLSLFGDSVLWVLFGVCVVPMFLLGIVGGIWYLVETWKKAKDECWDLDE